MPGPKKIFHLYDKNESEHRYYGSLQAVFNDSRNVFFVSKFTLDRFDFDTKEYEDNSVIIRKGHLLTSSEAKEISNTEK